MKLDHIVLNVKDVDLSIEFYCSIFEFEPERLQDFRNGKVPFPSVRIDANTLIDLFPPHMSGNGSDVNGGPPNLNHFCIAMSQQEWDSVRRRLSERNVIPHRDHSVNFGAHGNGISMYFFDPDGNEIEARYYEGE
jgi:catechol 2,3-dioxygenase-like lactoylglutathione lyase family enzyme